MAKIKIRRAFDLKSNKSSKNSKYTKGSTRSNGRKRNTSVTSQLSQESLKKIHTFALKGPKGKNAPPKDAKNEEEAEAGKLKTKVYYVEEHVKVLSEIIASADPILSELASQIHQFHKLTAKKISANQRDIDLFDRYGKDDFMTERDKLKISFHNLEEIEAM